MLFGKLIAAIRSLPSHRAADAVEYPLETEENANLLHSRAGVNRHLDILFRDIRIGNLSGHGWLYSHLFTSWIHDPKLASLGYALMVITFWWFVCWVMSRLGWSIRV